MGTSRSERAVALCALLLVASLAGCAEPELESVGPLRPSISEWELRDPTHLRLGILLENTGSDDATDIAGTSIDVYYRPRGDGDSERTKIEDFVGREIFQATDVVPPGGLHWLNATVTLPSPARASSTFSLWMRTSYNAGGEYHAWIWIACRDTEGEVVRRGDACETLEGQFA